MQQNDLLKALFKKCQSITYWKLYYIFILATMHGLWDLINNSLTRDQTPGPSGESIES